MGIPVKRSLFISHCYIAKAIPAHECLGKLERPVLNQLGIQAAVGSEVDILEKKSIHGGLDRCTLFIHIDNQSDILLLCKHASHKAYRS